MQPSEPPMEIPFWRRDGFPYFRQSVFLRQRFGGRVQKVSLDGGFTCPNVDGTVARGGCTFCDNRSFQGTYFTGLFSFALSVFYLCPVDMFNFFVDKNRLGMVKPFMLY